MNEVHLHTVNLLGVDVGFSKTRPTTGIAWLKGKNFGASRTHSDWERRSRSIPDATVFSVIAIDGPLVPVGSDEGLARHCESLFIRGVFQKRCKPGLSQHGYGRALRRATSETAEQLAHLSQENETVKKAIRPGTAIIEAFPNAFLGVLLPEACFAMSAAGKRKKFDWLYRHAVEGGFLHSLFRALQWDNNELLAAVLAETDHEKRAAWICLLTAACAAMGTAAAVGDETGGWFWLPPLELWAPWARQALEMNQVALA